MRMYHQGMLSVIVPAYNVSDYITECIESICSQTYQNLEIIVVDDGSTDGTSDVCDGFKDPRICVIHQQNRGLSGARNTGLKNASGQYVAFIDSDDLIRKDMFEKMMNIITEKEIDFVSCGVEFLRCDNGTSTYSGNSKNISFFDYEQSLDALRDIHLFNVWNKIYKHDVIDGLYFTEGVVCEDVEYTAEVFRRIKNTAYIDEPLYIYRVKRPGSSGMTFDERKLPAIHAYEEMFSYLKKEGYKSKVAGIRRSQLAMIRSLYNETEDDDIKNRWAMYKLYIQKLFKDGVVFQGLISNVYFLLMPWAVRKNYQRDRQKI